MTLATNALGENWKWSRAKQRVVFALQVSRWRNHLNLELAKRGKVGITKYIVPLQVFLSLAFRQFKWITNALGWKLERCWTVNRGDLSPVESCEGARLRSSSIRPVGDLLTHFPDIWCTRYLPYFLKLITAASCLTLVPLTLVNLCRHFPKVMNVLARDRRRQGGTYAALIPSRVVERAQFKCCWMLEKGW